MPMSEKNKQTIREAMSLLGRMSAKNRTPESYRRGDSEYYSKQRREFWARRDRDVWVILRHGVVPELPPVKVYEAPVGASAVLRAWRRRVGLEQAEALTRDYGVRIARVSRDEAAVIVARG